MYQIEFKLINIHDGSNDPYEFHLYISKEDRKDIAAEILDKDFTFKLNSNWIVSVGCDKGGAWYIKGSQGHRNSGVGHYNAFTDQICHESKFNDDLRSYCPDIKKRRFKGEFDTKTKIVTIKNE